MRDDTKAAAIEADYTTAPFSERERAIVDYVVKLTRTPASVTRADIAALRTAGLTDGAILDACQVAGYYAFANRLVDGLGVELEEYWDADGASP